MVDLVGLDQVGEFRPKYHGLVDYFDWFIPDFRDFALEDLASSLLLLLAEMRSQFPVAFDERFEIR